MAVVASGLPDPGYVEHWQVVKSLSDNGAKSEALRNLNAMLFEKDQDLCRYKEKYEQCEKVLKRTQQQLDNLLKKQYQQTSPTDPNVPNFPSATACGSLQPSFVAMAAVTAPAAVGQAVTLRAAESFCSAAALSDSKPLPASSNGALTARGSPMPPSSPDTRIFAGSAELAAGARKVVLRDWSPMHDLHDEHGFDTVDEPTPLEFWSSGVGGASMPLSGQQQQQQSLPAAATTLGHIERHCASLPVTSRCLLAAGPVGQSSLEQLAAQPTVSAAVLKNLIKENLRMKKVIDEMRRREGGVATVSKLMDAAEAERALTRLKQELQTKQKQVDELQSALCSGGQGHNSADSYQQSLTAKVALLESKVEKLNRSLEVKQRTILSLNSSLQKVTSADVAIAKETESYRSELTDVEKLQIALKKLEKEHLEETGVLNTQLQIFRDDFEAERKEKRRLSDDYESKLAKLTAQVSNLKTQLQAAHQELYHYHAKASRGTAPDLWSAQCSLSLPRSTGSASLSPTHCFSATSPGVSSAYNCPQCHLAFGTEASFQTHIDMCLRGSK